MSTLQESLEAPDPQRYDSSTTTPVQIQDPSINRQSPSPESIRERPKTPIPTNNSSSTESSSGSLESPLRGSDTSKTTMPDDAKSSISPDAQHRPVQNSNQGKENEEKPSHPNTHLNGPKTSKSKYDAKTLAIIRKLRDPVGKAIPKNQNRKIPSSYLIDRQHKAERDTNAYAQSQRHGSVPVAIEELNLDDKVVIPPTRSALPLGYGAFNEMFKSKHADFKDRLVEDMEALKNDKLALIESIALPTELIPIIDQLSRGLDVKKVLAQFDSQHMVEKVNRYLDSQNGGTTGAEFQPGFPVPDEGGIPIDDQKPSERFPRNEGFIRKLLRACLNFFRMNSHAFEDLVEWQKIEFHIPMLHPVRWTRRKCDEASGSVRYWFAKIICELSHRYKQFKSLAREWQSYLKEWLEKIPETGDKIATWCRETMDSVKHWSIDAVDWVKEFVSEGFAYAGNGICRGLQTVLGWLLRPKTWTCLLLVAAMTRNLWLFFGQHYLDFCNKYDPGVALSYWLGPLLLVPLYCLTETLYSMDVYKLKAQFLTLSWVIGNNLLFLLDWTFLQYRWLMAAVSVWAAYVVRDEVLKTAPLVYETMNHTAAEAGQTMQYWLDQATPHVSSVSDQIVQNMPSWSEEHISHAVENCTQYSQSMLSVLITMIDRISSSIERCLQLLPMPYLSLAFATLLIMIMLEKLCADGSLWSFCVTVVFKTYKFVKESAMKCYRSLKHSISASATATSDAVMHVREKLDTAPKLSLRAWIKGILFACMDATVSVYLWICDGINAGCNVLSDIFRWVFGDLSAGVFATLNAILCYLKSWIRYSFYVVKLLVQKLVDFVSSIARGVLFYLAFVVNSISRTIRFVFGSFFNWLLESGFFWLGTWLFLVSSVAAGVMLAMWGCGWWTPCLGEQCKPVFDSLWREGGKVIGKLFGSHQEDMKITWDEHERLMSKKFDDMLAIVRAQKANKRWVGLW